MFACYQLDTLASWVEQENCILNKTILKNDITDSNEFTIIHVR